MTSIPQSIVFEPRSRLEGTIRTPGDKSISHRALLIGALSDGETFIEGLSDGGDVQSTRTIIGQLGATVHDRVGEVVVSSKGAHALRASNEPLDCGNSGTTIRLLMGVVAGIQGTHHLVGDDSLSRRPMDRVARPLRLMGAEVSGSGSQETPPLTVRGGPLRGIDYSLPVPSAQVKSAILFAGLDAVGATVIHEPATTRQHTEEMLLQAGAQIDVVVSDPGSTITLLPSTLQPQRWVIPADPSNAAFFVVAGLLAREGAVSCERLYLGGARTGFLEVLDRMGGSLHREINPDQTINVTSTPHQLMGTEVKASEIPSLDEIPILAVAAAASTGVTRFMDADELRIKESDRFQACLDLVIALGARAWAEGSTLCVEGVGNAQRFERLNFVSRGDHRLALSAAIASVVGAGGTVSGFGSISTNYPGFLDDLERLA